MSSARPMTSRERVLAALRRRVPDRVPTFEWFIDPVVGRALTGSDDLLDVVEALDLDARMMAEVHQQADGASCRVEVVDDLSPVFVAQGRDRLDLNDD